MLKRAYCENKFNEIETQLKHINGKTECLSEYREHIKRLRRSYQKEYAKALLRKEPPVGLLDEPIKRPSIGGYAIDNKQSLRGFFEEGFHNF